MQGWEQKEAAQRYLRTIDVLVPKRQEILSIISTLASELASEHPTILDLGSGAGDVTAAILEQAPVASATLVDFSDEMIAVSRERFAGFQNVRILKQDLNLGLPANLLTDTFDIAVSCFSLHHIEFDNRVRLYADVRNVLKRGGLFINGDRFKGESSNLAEWEFDNWIRSMTVQIKEKLKVQRTFAEVKATQIASDKRLGDKPGTIWEMERDLREAGFGYVDCLWKHDNLAIIAATK